MTAIGSGRPLLLTVVAIGYGGRLPLVLLAAVGMVLLAAVTDIHGRRARLLGSRRGKRKEMGGPR